MTKLSSVVSTQLRAVVVLVISVAVVWVVAAVWMHSTQIHAECRARYTDELNANSAALEAACSKHSASYICTTAREFVMTNSDHWVNSCVMSDIKHHVQDLVHPMTAFAIYREAISFSTSWMFMIAVVLFVVVYLNRGSLANASDARRAFFSASSNPLPVYDPTAQPVGAGVPRGYWGPALSALSEPKGE